MIGVSREGEAMKESAAKGGGGSVRGRKARAANHFSSKLDTRP